MPGVELSSGACDGHVVVALHGELDVAGAPEVQAAITALVARGRCLVIDMSALDFIDCTSLGALVQARRRYPWRRLAVRTARLGRAAPSRTGTG
jgi:anti-sigma B factor antagonist